MLGRDLAFTLDPGLTAAAVGLDLDEWQETVLSGQHRRLLLCCARQSGKTSICALTALHELCFNAPSLVLCLSPSLRQSTELVRKVHDFHASLDGAPEIKMASATRLELVNGSRIIGLPGAERTVRGYSGARLILLDEAARIDDNLIAAIKPTQATVADARFIALSTPAGKRGWFYEQWSDGHGWRKIMITADQCPRISREFLEAERRELGEQMYRAEYDCDFLDDADGAFPMHVIERAFVDDIEPCADLRRFIGL